MSDFITDENNVDALRARILVMEGLAKLDLEVTNLAAKAGKGEVVGALSLPVGHGIIMLKKVASSRMLHQPNTGQNIVSYSLRRRVEDPLLEATKYLKLLQKSSPDSLETHLLSFEVNMRRQKILLALQAMKQLLRLDAENPDSHRCLIRFFHKVDSMAAPVTDTEKLIWSVLEAERPSISQLHGISLVEENRFFFEKYKGSLMHRAAVAEMLCLLEPDKKSEAVNLIEDSSNYIVPSNGALGPGKEWRLKDCVAIHKLLQTALLDNDAAPRWKAECAKYFPHSTYFEGRHSSAMPNSVYNQVVKNPVNGSASHPGGSNISDSIASNGKLEAFKDLAI